ncbi:MAG: O-antigen ligase family protein [Patescibacteria group bacterium]
MRYFKKVGAVLLYLLVFLLPLQTRLIIRPGMVNFGYLEYGTISLYLTDIILVVLLSFLALNFLLPQAKKFLTISWFSPKIKTDYALMALVFLELIVFVSVFFAPYKLLAIYKYSLFLLGIIIFLIISRSEFFSRLKLIYSLLAGIFLQAILAIYQFVTQSTFASKILGLAAHNSAISGVSVVEVYNRQGLLLRWLRSYGGLDHPNILGGVLAIGIIILLGLLVERKKWQIAEKHKRLFIIINYSLLFFFSVALLFTFSRAAYLAVLIGGATVLILSGACHLKEKMNPKSLECGFILGFGLLFIVVCSMLFSAVDLRFFNDSRLDQISNHERIGGYAEAVRSVVTRPLTGWGVGNYYLSLYDREPYFPSYFYQPAHNVLLLVAAEIGIVGALLFILFIGFIAGKKLLNFKHNGLALALIFALFIMAMVDHWLWSLHFGIFFFWLVLGIVTWEIGDKKFGALK